MQVTKQGESDQSLDIEYWFLSCLFTLHSWGSSHSQSTGWQQLECCSGSAVAPGSPLE